MTDLSITDFLTARYDEDEAVADRALSSPASAEIDNYGRLTLPAWRVLADIAAKRRIVQFCDPSDGYEGHILRLLASPFSDHPDFNPDWSVDDGSDVRD